MHPTKTLSAREKELQVLLATPPGRAQLRELKERYQKEGGRMHPAGRSVITYILVHERQKGLIVG